MPGWGARQVPGHSTGVQFKYGREQVLAALECNAQYAQYRRQHGEQAARQSGLGQAISYRFKRDGKGWRVFVTTDVMASVPVVTDQRPVAPSAWT